MNFENYRLWPHQLDLLNGPLLEDDDDINLNDLVCMKQDVAKTTVKDNCSDIFISPTIRPAPKVTDLVSEKVASAKNGRQEVLLANNSRHTLGNTGMVVYIGRKHGACKESDEEVDVETVEDELEATAAKRICKSPYHTSIKHTERITSAVQEKPVASTSLLNGFFNDTAFRTKQSNNQNNCSAFQSAEKWNESVCNNTTVLQANDLVSLLEQFEASEELVDQQKNFNYSAATELSPTCATECSDTIQDVIPPATNDLISFLEQFETSQESLKPEEITNFQGSLGADILPEPVKRINVNAQEVALKNVSSSVIEKIKMSSMIKKGPILIPPEHKHKVKASRSVQSATLETTKKSYRTPSNSNLSVHQPPAVSNDNQYLLIPDHDYCSFLCSEIKKKESESLDQTNQPFNKSSPCLIKNFLNCENESLGSISNGNPNVSSGCNAIFVPDAQVEVEIVDNQIDLDGLVNSVENTLCVTDSESKKNKNIVPLGSSCNIDFSDESKNCNSEYSKTTFKNTNNGCTVRNMTTDKSSRRLPDQYSQKQIVENEFISSSKYSHDCLQPNSKDSTPCSSPVHVSSSSSSVEIQNGKRRRSESFSRSRSPSPRKRPCHWMGAFKDNYYKKEKTWMRRRANSPDGNGRHFWKSEKQKQIEERRVVYVGKLKEGMKVDDLRKCFSKFGPIQDISIHFRDSGDNYGFVTFYHRNDAYTVVERGRQDPELTKYDLCFGGRRQFCKTRYSDLDSVNEDPLSWSAKKMDFDTLLKVAKAQANVPKQHLHSP